MANLILTYRAGKTILISHDIEITLLESHGTGARIVVRIPQHVSILRAELKSHKEPSAPGPLFGTSGGSGCGDGRAGDCARLLMDHGAAGVRWTLYTILRSVESRGLDAPSNLRKTHAGENSQTVKF